MSLWYMPCSFRWLGTASKATMLKDSSIWRGADVTVGSLSWEISSSFPQTFAAAVTFQVACFSSEDAARQTSGKWSASNSYQPYGLRGYPFEVLLVFSSQLWLYRIAGARLLLEALSRVPERHQRNLAWWRITEQDCKFLLNFKKVVVRISLSRRKDLC